MIHEVKKRVMSQAGGYSFKKYRRRLNRKKNYVFFKRMVDILLSSFVIIFLLSWLMPLLGMLIKLSSRGPVFFIQRRVGYAGKSFPCIKFRTMRVNAEADKRAATKNDDRVTKLGHFLRSASLDELPQFFNVFLGHMSIVGPRPHMFEDCNKFSNYINNYKFRNLMKPGITGLAQVKGFRGPAETFEDIFHRYQYDAFYIRNANFWLDIRIIRKTAVQTVLQIVGKIAGLDNLYDKVSGQKIYRKLTLPLRQMRQAVLR